MEGPDGRRQQMLDLARPGKVVSLNFTSWNRMVTWLRRIDGLRHVA
jgi:hypothetical protein